MILERNLAILCLSNNYGKIFGKKVADFLEMFYVNIEDILEYNLISEDMLKSAGIEYFEKEKQKIIDAITDYDNSLFVCNLNTFFEKDNISKFKPNCVVIYLRFDRNCLENIEQNYEIKRRLYAFEEEDKLCVHFADIVVDMDYNDNVHLENLKVKLLDYFRSKNIWTWTTNQ